MCFRWIETACSLKEESSSCFAVVVVSSGSTCLARVQRRLRPNTVRSFSCFYSIDHCLARIMWTDEGNFYVIRERNQAATAETPKQPASSNTEESKSGVQSTSVAVFSNRSSLCAPPPAPLPSNTSLQTGL